MALITCGECGNQLSDKATLCSKCGAPRQGVTALDANGLQAAADSTPAAAAKATKTARRITPARVVLWLLILGGCWLIFRVNTGSSLAGAIHGPQTIVSESIQLKEGEATGYGFELPSSRRVEVQVAASPKDINVMLMSESQWKKYQQVKGSLFGGEYKYTQALSRQKVLQWSGNEVIPAGSWRIVVERPREAMLFGKATNATVKIIGY